MSLLQETPLREASVNKPIGLTAGYCGRAHRAEHLQHFSER
ncbi:MAG: hypothetical protein AVDCRST_MAG37-3354 [uncultured Rubrobacteraceae bacterium]|uniref:Uncharacterized protein n=1 Tax=uncultured Rubrobacteraceae bacterium TaxID=349277 RepID=A0A6J4R194_9ACTN|nr:MAG: hypothetical protein AVDCRST_MAG37-3354 [uncultured Rubrobacteraceae bacterium]